jgi:hypothetical protein
MANELSIPGVVVGEWVDGWLKIWLDYAAIEDMDHEHQEKFKQFITNPLAALPWARAVQRYKNDYDNRTYLYVKPKERVYDGTTDDRSGALGPSTILGHESNR